MKKYEHLIYSAVGLVALFLLLVAFNYLASTAAARVDLTEGKLYTLSEGTKKILRGLDVAGEGEALRHRRARAMPVQLRSFAQRVEDLVREFKAVAGGNLRGRDATTRKPDSEEEDAAQLDGIEPQQLYIGRAVLPRRRGEPARAQAGDRRRSPRSASACSSTTWCAPSRASARRAPEDRPDERRCRCCGERFNPVHAAELRALGARQRAAGAIST